MEKIAATARRVLQNGKYPWLTVTCRRFVGGRQFLPQPRVVAAE
jgi:hypothetical protein